MRTILILLFLLFSFPPFVQFCNGFNMTFGKNSVQYKEFLWTCYKFPDSDIHFYCNRRPLANFISEYAMKQTSKMENKTEVSLDRKIKFIVSNTLNYLKQTNTGLIHDDSSMVESGLNSVLQYKALLYFDVNYSDFKIRF